MGFNRQIILLFTFILSFGGLSSCSSSSLVRSGDSAMDSIGADGLSGDSIEDSEVPLTSSFSIRFGLSL